MTMPLILQIQEAALDSKSSVTDALRKAKVACVKLDLVEFGEWVDRELSGYMNMKVLDLPPYRQLHGRPEAYNPYHGWQPINFQSSKYLKRFSFAPLGMAMSAIEASLPVEKSGGNFFFPYQPEIQEQLRKAIDWDDDLHIKLETSQIVGVVDAVRNILLNWTIEMEKKGDIRRKSHFFRRRAEEIGFCGCANHNQYTDRASWFLCAKR